MEREDYADIVAGVREGRFTAEGARRMLEQRQRDVRAHSNAQALKQAHDALDRGHPANYSDDEFSGLFNPSTPLGPDDDDTSMTGPGHFTPPIKRPVQQSEQSAWPRQQKASAPLSDDELFTALWGRAPKPGELDD